MEAEPLGIVSLAEAIAQADELETDLVEIAPKSKTTGVQANGLRQI